LLNVAKVHRSANEISTDTRRLVIEAVTAVTIFWYMTPSQGLGC